MGATWVTTEMIYSPPTTKNTCSSLEQTQNKVTSVSSADMYDSLSKSLLYYVCLPVNFMFKQVQGSSLNSYH